MTITDMIAQAQTTNTAVTELGPIGSLTYNLGKFTSFQCYDDGGVSTYVAGLDPVASSDGTYSLFSFQADTSGVLGDSPNLTQTFDSFYDNLLGLTLPVSDIPTITVSPAVMVRHMARMGLEADTTLVTPTNPYLVFGNGLTANSSGRYPAFVAPTTESGGIDMSSAATTDLDLPYDLVQSFESGDGLYLMLVCSTANDEGVYPYTILSVTPSGTFGDNAVGSGTLERPYLSMATFTVFQQSGTGTSAGFTTVPYVMALTAGTSGATDWFVMPITGDASSETMVLGSIAYSGSLTGTFGAVTALSSPVTNNVFMFVSSSTITSAGFPWTILQVTDGAQVGDSQTGNPSTLMDPDAVSQGNALLSYGRFVGLDVGGMSYLMGFVGSASTSGTYLYTTQYPSVGGVLLPTSFTSEYLRAIVAQSNNAYANANAGAEAPKVTLTGSQVKQYAEEIETYQSQFLDATQTWTEQRAQDVSDLLAAYVNVQGQFAALKEDLSGLNSASTQFSVAHGISISVGKTGQMTGKEWMTKYLAQGQANLSTYNTTVLGSYESTILGLIEDALGALGDITSQSGKNSDVLNDFASTLDEIDSQIEGVQTAIVGATGVDTELLKKYKDDLKTAKATLAEVNEELHKWLLSAIAVGLVGAFATTSGVAAIILSATTANVVGFLIFLAFEIYAIVTLIKEYKSLKSQQAKALNDISKDQAEINELQEEITELNNLSALSGALSLSVNGVSTAAQGSVTSLNGIASDLRVLGQQVMSPGSLTQDMVVDWLASTDHGLYKKTIIYDPGAKLDQATADTWTFRANTKISSLYVGVPAILSGKLTSLVNTCALAESLQATTQLSYKTETLASLNASAPTVSNQ